MTNQFSDFSSNNPDPDENAYVASGNKFIAFKATEGLGYVWGHGTTLADAFRARGLKVIRYHFARPGASGTAQARFFLANVNHDDLLCLDLEGNSWAAGEANQVFQDFAAEVEKQTGRKGLIYCGAYFISGNNVVPRKGWAWWIPAYTRTRPADPPGWPDPWAWQDTDQGRIPGMNANGDVSIIQNPSQLDPATPPPPKPAPQKDPSYGLAPRHVWWTGHGDYCVDDLPDDAKGVFRDGNAVALWVDHGWYDTHDIPPGAVVANYHWGPVGWVPD